MSDYDSKIDLAASKLSEADYILVGAGAGLSESAGLNYHGARFLDNFSDFIARYNLKDMYTATFYPFETEEEFWAFWSRHIYINSFEEGALEIYKELLSLVQFKNYFVITTNVDNQFENANFPKEKYFEVQGNYAYLQCAAPCHDKTYFNKEIVSSMIPNIYRCKVPTDLVPRCPVCGGKMDIYLHKDKRFLQGTKWKDANRRYVQFLENTIDKKIIYFELGVGLSTPKIIRFPFERLKTANPFSTLIRVNKEFPNTSTKIHDREIIFQNDIGLVLEDLTRVMG